MSPTVLRSGPYRLFFFSNEGSEPRHIHIQREQMLAKFWLDPVRIASSTASSPTELRRLQRLVEEKAPELREAWDEYFKQQS